MAGTRPAHLARRGAVYLVRFRLPHDLAPRLGMTELRRSLHTADIGLARLRCLSATLWFRSTVEDLRKMDEPSRSALERAALAYFERLKSEAFVPRKFDQTHFEEEVALNVEMSEEQITRLRLVLQSNTYSKNVMAEASELADDQGLGSSLSADAQQQLARLVTRAQLAFQSWFIHGLATPEALFRSQDELFDEQVATTVSAPRPQQAVPHQPSSKAPLDSLGADYLSKTKARGVGDSHVTELGRVLRWLQEVLGSDADLNTVTKAQVRIFRNDLTRLDIRKRGQLLPFPQRLTNDLGQHLKYVTVDRYWRSAQGFFQWCAAEGFIDVDPTVGLRLDRPKGETPISPAAFENWEVERFLRTVLYQGYKSPKRMNTGGTCRLRKGHWWSGVLMMHTGLRAGELSQLLPTDFIFDAEIPHLKVQLEDGDGSKTKSAKTASSIRDVPLHPILLRLGLQEFVTARAKSKPKERVFSEFRLGNNGRQSEGMTRFWGDYLQAVGLWSAGRATHVWRHTVVANLRANGVAEEDIAAWVGHSRGTQTQRYGGDYGLARKLQTIGHLNYDFDVLAALGGSYKKAVHG